MKTLLSTLLLALLFSNVFATDYYFSATSGDDSRSSNEATNSSTPWKSISKLNSIFSTLQPGDRIFFKRGDSFYGTIKPTKSGTSTKPITFSAYGSGDRPIITGSVTLTDWVSKGGGIYESYNASLGSTISMLSINNAAVALGRYPNRSADLNGYLILESHTTKSITDKELNSSTNWTGAELALRTRHWIIDRLKISAHSGGTITFSTAPTYEPEDNYGYFIQNHIKTLDLFGEWCYTASTKKVSMYFGSADPSKYSVKASVLADIVDVNNQDYFTFDNITFSGSNENNISLYSADGIKIQNCEVSLSGEDGITASNTNGLTIESSSILSSSNNGLDLSSNNNTSVIRNNIIKNSGSMPGMGPNGNQTNIGIRINGNNSLIEYNVVDSSGYAGIRFNGDHMDIRNNVVSNFSFVKDDGGGIYSANGSSPERVDRTIANNIVFNGIGAKEGTSAKTVQQVSGIYLDGNASGVMITGNTVFNCGKVGLYIHNAFKIDIYDNTIYNNTAQGMLNHDDAKMSPLTKVVMKRNIFFSKKPEQVVAYFYSKLLEMRSFGTIDSNYYARPLDESLTMKATTSLYTTSAKNYSLDILAWTLMYGHDSHSKNSPKTFSKTSNPDDNILFEYNDTKSNKTISLPGTYVDAKNKSYSGNVILAPYSSIVLIKTGSAAAPLPATPVVALTSPLASASYNSGSSVLMTANASVTGTTISKVEFYNGSTLLSTQTGAPYTWSWANVAAGTYSITAKATASNGNTATSAIAVITVNAETSGPVVSLTSPVVNATYAVASNVQITATASVNGATISKVEFYNGSTLLNTQKSAPYNWAWTNVKAGSYTITARATASNGSVTVSSPVVIDVAASAAAPLVNLTSPVAGSSYTSSASVILTANASVSGASISKVEFYNGSSLLNIQKTAPYNWTWKSVKAGSYTITAKATASNGNVTTSTATVVTVKASGSASMLDESFTETSANIVSRIAVKASLYPNPAAGSINIQLSEPQNNEKLSITISNAAGIAVKRISSTLSGTLLSLDISSLNTGVYVVTVSGSKRLFSGTFIKN